MKKFYLIIAVLFFINNGFSQTTATKEHVRKLLELTGAGNIGVQVMQNMIATYKKELPNVPDKFWNGFMNAANADTLVDLMIPIYIKYYTDDDVINLIQFYESPLGKKVTETLPMITKEAYNAGSEWGKRLSEQLIEKLEEEKYIKNN